MSERLLPSRFSYDEGCGIFETTERSEPPDERPATGERVILQLLKKYGYLTMPLIQKNIEMYHRTINAKKSVRKMQQRNLILKYTIQYTDEDIADIDVYILTPKGAEMAGESGKKPYRFDMTNIPYILENLSAAQWHMAVMSDKKAHEEMYQHTVRVKGNIVTIYSLIKYRTDFGRYLHLCGIPIEKGIHRKDLGRFVAKILLMNEYLASKPDRYRSYIIVISCESQRQIEDVAKVLGTINETKEIYFMYTIDAITSDSGINPLSMLYTVEEEGGRYKTKVASLH